MNGLETEVKFYVKDLQRVKTRLLDLKARLSQPRVHEVNLRFDTRAGDLRKKSKVLRLRQDTEAKFTFKGPGKELDGGVVSREEIEFIVGDFEAARKFLEALGYELIIYYEKFRTTYEINDIHVMLDEMPYGSFVEIEGDDVDSLKNSAAELGLNWKVGIKKSYHALFERIVRKYKVNKSQLSFKELQNLQISPEDLNVTPADNDDK